MAPQPKRHQGGRGVEVHQHHPGALPAGPLHAVVAGAGDDDQGAAPIQRPRDPADHRLGVGIDTDDGGDGIGRVSPQPIHLRPEGPHHDASQSGEDRRQRSDPRQFETDRRGVWARVAAHREVAGAALDQTRCGHQRGEDGRMVGVVTSPVGAESQNRRHGDEGCDQAERNTHHPVAIARAEGQHRCPDQHGDNDPERRHRSRPAEPPEHPWQRVDDRGPQTQYGQIDDQQQAGPGYGPTQYGRGCLFGTHPPNSLSGISAVRTSNSTRERSAEGNVIGPVRCASRVTQAGARRPLSDES